MKLIAIHPSKLLLRLILFLATLVFCASYFFAGFNQVLYAGVFVIFLMAIIEAFSFYRVPALSINRELPNTIAVNQTVTIELTLSHAFTRSTSIELVDCLPTDFSKPHLPHVLTLQPQQKSSIQYQAEPLSRGKFSFHNIEVRIPGLFNLLMATFTVPCKNQVKVFPDFSAIAAYTILATDNHASQIGILKRIGRGEGSEFHQLRQYQVGDTLRQVNWKASAKRKQLISIEYQRERDQQIIIMVDNGRRMRSRDGNLSHFDHALNALILVSYIALRQGDSVGVLSFGSSQRWIPPGRGEKHSSVILNGLYDLQADNTASDYIEAAEFMVHNQRKRSLIIMLTNSRDEDLADLVKSSHLLGSRHLILMANIREEFLETESKVAVESFQQALQYCGLQSYKRKRQETLKALHAMGVHSIDCSSSTLAANVSNAYLEIKNSGLL